MVTHPIIQQAGPGLRYLLGRIVTDRLNAGAAALTFVSLFALSPLLTVTLSIAFPLPAAGDIEGKLSEFLLQFLLPNSSTRVVQSLSTLIEHKRSLTMLDVTILFVTAILMLRNVENALNDIWCNRANRKPQRSFFLYWTVLSLGPLAIDLGLGARAYVFGAAKEFGNIQLWCLFGTHSSAACSRPALSPSPACSSPQ